MTPANTNIEKSAIGEQYAIPGTERQIKPQRPVYKADGSDQFETWVRP
jgi:hypothetical protein